MTQEERCSLVVVGGMKEGASGLTGGDEKEDGRGCEASAPLPDSATPPVPPSIATFNAVAMLAVSN